MSTYYENYANVAEVYPLSVRNFAKNEEALKKELRNMDGSPYPILDIGSGTGRTVMAIAESISDTEIFAVEPSSVMRAVLTQRILLQEDLKKRVTIISSPIEDLELSEQLGGVVAYGVLGHLDREARQNLWTLLLPKLQKGAPIFVELMPMGKPMTFPPMPIVQEKIGRRKYEATLSGKLGHDDLMHVIVKWTLSGGLEPIREIENTNYWHTFSLEDLAQETGLEMKKLTEESGVLYA